MHGFDTVFVQLVYNQSDAVFHGHSLSLGGKTVKLLDNKTADGVVILRNQGNVQLLVDIVELGRTESYILQALLDFF